MDKFIKYATESTPFICFNPETNILLIKGNSYPENSYEFYKPVREWMKQYLSQLSGLATLDLELLFLNTSSSRFLLSIFEMMDNVYSEEKKITVNWHYFADNEMGQVYYEYFKENLSIPFHIIKKTETGDIVWEEKEKLFEDEMQLLTKIKEKYVLEIPETHILYHDFNTLITHYEKNLNETKRMIQISDLLEKNLKETNNKLKWANELKSQLIALTLHDLKNPLTVIKAYLSLLKKQLDLTPKQDRIFQAMEGAALRMQNLIVEILENERIELESIALKPEKINMPVLIDDVITQNTLFLEEKNQKLIFEPDPTTLYAVYTDKIILKEIIDNLVSNAIKYTPLQKQIEISLAKTTGQNGECRIKTSVKDEGPGLSKEETGQLFKKFQKLSTKPTGNESSTGIGLYLSQKFSALLKGKLEVESEPGKGCIFSFEIAAAE